MKRRIIAYLCTVSILLSAMTITVFADVNWQTNAEMGINHKTGTELEAWKSENFEKKASITNQEYSFVLVGDTQYITYPDARDNTTNLKKIYKWIADNKDTKKIAQVFALGDITCLSYGNDKTLINDLSYSRNYGTGMAEWNVVKAATDQLKEAGVSFAVLRGHMDDYSIDNVYGEDVSYTSQFDGFFRTGAGRYNENSITNSWKKIDVHGDKYLILTIDFNTRRQVLNWANDIIEKNPDRKVIIATHGYLWGDGTHAKAEIDYDVYKGGLSAINDTTIDGEMLWEKLVRKHANIFMVLCGHVSTGNNNVGYTYRTGDNGNKITEITVNTQEFDKNYTYTGLVCVLNFFDDGQRVELEYYSTLLDSYKKGNSDVIRFDDAPSRDVGDIDIVEVAEEKGRNILRMDSPVSTAPILDGSIGEGEYSVSRTVTNSSIRSGVLESNLKEYMAYDGKYIYYAFSVKQSTPQTVLLQIMPKTHYNSASEILKGYLDRPTLARISYGDSGFVKKDMSSWTSSNTSIPAWDSDVFMSASYDRASKITTYEIKISRQYLKNNNYDDSQFGYVLFIGSAQYCWTDPSFLGITPNWYYNFVSISSPVNTLGKENTDISTDDARIRFKTVIDKEFLNEIINSNPTASISVGTLIAPADKLGDRYLTHDFGESGVDYLDVIATIGVPFCEGDTTNTYAGSIKNIKEKNIGRNFVAVGYVKISMEGQQPSYFYSSTESIMRLSFSGV